MQTDGLTSLSDCFPVALSQYAISLCEQVITEKGEQNLGSPGWRKDNMFTPMSHSSIFGEDLWELIYYSDTANLWPILLKVNCMSDCVG